MDDQGSHRQRQTAYLKKVTITPSITSSELKKELYIPLQNVSERTIRHRLQKEIDKPSRRAAFKPMLNTEIEEQTSRFLQEIKRLVNRTVNESHV